MTITRVGSNEKYAEGWSKAFGKGKASASQASAKKKAPKKAAPKKKASKKAKK